MIMYRYAVVVEGEEGSYSAYAPDLPGCIAAGQTLDEVRTLMREAIELHIRGLLEDGLPVPEATTAETYFETVEVAHS
jgi:predicted RNase H-like HicB family nuclease